MRSVASLRLDIYNARYCVRLWLAQYSVQNTVLAQLHAMSLIIVTHRGGYFASRFSCMQKYTIATSIVQDTIEDTGRGVRDIETVVPSYALQQIDPSNMYFTYHVQLNTQADTSVTLWTICMRSRNITSRVVFLI